MKKEFVHTSESLTDGHPDKMCDQVSDAIVDRFLETDPKARVVAECAISLSVVFVAARFASGAKVDFPNVARKVIRRIGYIDHEFNYKTCSILTSLKDMAPRRDHSYDESELTDEQIEQIPANEQVTVFGFACDQAPTLIPTPIWLAHKLARRLSEVRRENRLDYLAPDGSTQVGVEYKDRKPHRIHSLTINASQIDRNYPNQNVLRDDIMETVIRPVFEDEPFGPDNNTRLFINHGGPLKMGGPSAHSGMTGRKNAVDTYGGYSRTGGAALSGKDPLRIDRIGAYAARHAAKNIVAAGLADECEVWISYSIGLARPVSIQAETRGTGKISDDEISELIKSHFDFRMAGIVKNFDLRRRPQEAKTGFYRRLAVFGHFGRPDLDLPWEETNRVEELKAAL
jgi:S-adenosylmethionine synthetase